jgi:hypothetical protein
MGLIADTDIVRKKNKNPTLAENGISITRQTMYLS